ncbi:hypothetical protein BATDEDRAFT_34290 [Batrachochytrium dendrobatidis JAM81]|uniref:Uncharacterized protein n=2 Tax=Batrachochytrium dendrobatidis TaxID=109871 RepID=F4NUG5_BATDJ|nr:uncharacterized protein BATDEDRAFT_22445 [Batrachochytrium dendrobatidis JAM81]XP_006675814.1 uncharacterized protein BATDEDRAFT_34290 [Batrachochytrium dendrobatidis JAM81]KAJ8327322.1 hypothetical protein O5D80_004721 [Batrachochytrium dendrobatidis]OAJ37435.1 hypothetical protein BDEG_21453 [Batrachochytrium dendrobatidis JEL423]EGF83609.1 hypothetical protein BATDEDRAFT_22445 [Batrachochytrium dendrobatidis JAM81]EGF84408.1 hypothetical protein BATDEDRAFT_34290 [Batrachochytrium dendrob|eukprot:XP_006675571.1 hypothetical protein BATDEDRAFT_22445 [Batrachochytrium dendrobatidis JAM81]
MTAGKFAFQWRPWANLQAYYAAVFILIGSVISAWFPNRFVAGANLFISLLIIGLEHPFPYMDKLGFVSNNLYLRALLYAACVVPGLIQAPTHTGVLCLSCAALTYLWAAVCGESGAPAGKGSGKSAT